MRKYIRAIVLLINLLSCASFIEEDIDFESQENLKLEKNFYIFWDGKEHLFAIENNRMVEEVLQSELLNLKISFADKSQCDLSIGAYNYKTLNNIAIWQLFQKNYKTSEINLSSSFKLSAQDPIPFLNLLRFYFILEDYNAARQIIKSFLEKTKEENSIIKELLETLKKQNRLKERILILDEIVNYTPLDVEALNELGIYLYKEGLYSKAKPYFMKVLEIFSFDVVALNHLLLISSKIEDWKSAQQYGRALVEIGKYPTGTIYYLSKAEFELGNYQQSLKYINMASKEEKNSYWFLILWRNSLWSSDIRASLEPLKEYYSATNIDKFPAVVEEFNLLTGKEGRNIMDSIINGR